MTKKFVEHALLAQYAIVRSGARRVADAMGMLLGTDKLKYTKLPSGMYGYRGHIRTRGFRGNGMGKAGSRTNARMLIYLANDKKVIPKILKSNSDKEKMQPLPLGFIFVIAPHQAMNKFTMMALSSKPTKSPDVALFEVARMIDAAMTMWSEKLGKVSEEIVTLYSKGFFDDAAKLENNTEILHSPLPVRVYRTGATIGLEVRVGMAGIAQRKLGHRFGLSQGKSKSGSKEIWLRATPSMDIRQSVYNFYEMTGDTFYQMDSVSELIAKGIGRKPKIIKILKEGVKKSRVIVPLDILRKAEKAENA